MPDGQIVVFGADVIANPRIRTNSGAGTNGDGRIRVRRGERVFEDDDIVVIDVTNVDADGELQNNSGAGDLTVYDSYEDFLNGIVKFDYRPQNPGQTANLQSDLSGHGDGYARFVSANILQPQNGGPSFNQLMILPGTNVASIVGDGNGRLTKDRNEDFDFNLDGDTDDPNETGNTRFLAGDYVTPTICFTAGTMILTPEGERAVETLRPGDMVWTIDNGPQPIRWVGRRRLPASGQFAPVHFGTNTVGNIRPLEVSQNHRMLRSGAAIELLFGTSEVLVPAKFLVDGTAVTLRQTGWVDYVHILFDKHELVWANGAPCESLRPDADTTQPTELAGVAELRTLFPELADTADGAPETARHCLRRYEASLLTG